jgi:predicted metal-dependent peptidase
VLDTSGSMSDGMLAQALGEVGGVLRSLELGRRNLRVICCDARAYCHQRVLDAREVRLLGGGTLELKVVRGTDERTLQVTFTEPDHRQAREYPRAERSAGAGLGLSI